MKYKLLALDLDGTLTNSKKIITEKTKKVLFDAQKAGLRLVLASGRPTEGILHLAEELELKKHGGFVLAFNGARVFDLASGEIVFEQTLPMDCIPLVEDLADRHGVTVLTYKNGDIITKNPDDPYVALEGKINLIGSRFVNSFTEAVDSPVPKCLLVGDGDHMAELEPIFREALPHLSVYRSEPYFLEVMPTGVDKAYSLGKLLEHLGLERSDLAACGDGYNDISMVAFAGLGVAMANANDKLKEVSDVITLSNDEDGVAEAVLRYMMKNANEKTAYIREQAAFSFMGEKGEAWFMV